MNTKENTVTLQQQIHGPGPSHVKIPERWKRRKCGQIPPPETSDSGGGLSLSLFECERHGEQRRAWGGSKTKPGFVGPRWHALTVGPIQRRSGG
jgi:hypothetical protein